MLEKVKAQITKRDPNCIPLDERISLPFGDCLDRGGKWGSGERYRWIIEDSRPQTLITMESKDMILSLFFSFSLLTLFHRIPVELEVAYLGGLL